MKHAAKKKPQDQTETENLASPDRLKRILFFANELSESRLREIKSRNETRWNETARAQKRLLAQRHKPWMHSTGPRTKAGKSRSCHNAVKNRVRDERMRSHKRQLTAYSFWLQQIDLYIRFAKAKGPMAPYIQHLCFEKMKILRQKQISYLHSARRMIESDEKGNHSCLILCPPPPPIPIPNCPPPRFSPI